MSGTDDTPADDPRPWHGVNNPFEALFQWVKAELAKLAPEELDAVLESGVDRTLPPTPETSAQTDDGQSTAHAE